MGEGEVLGHDTPIWVEVRSKDILGGSRRIGMESGVTYSLHFLDDYLSMGTAGSGECARNLGIMMRVCEENGTPPEVE